MSHSMDYSMVAPKTCVLKLNICCSRCEKKVQKLLRNIREVHSFSIDKEHGKVTVSGTIDPHILKARLEKAGKTEFVYLDQSDENNQDMQIVPSKPILIQGQGINDNDPHMVAQLKQLSQIQGLKHVELTHSKTVKLTFIETGTHGAKIVVDDACGRQMCHGGGGGAGGGASPFCGGHESPHGCHNGACGDHLGLPRVCATHNQCGGGYYWPPPPCGCIPLPPPWPSWTAPGPQYVPNYDPTAPPAPVGYPYHSPSPFSDDNMNSCTVM